MNLRADTKLLYSFTASKLSNYFHFSNDESAEKAKVKPRTSVNQSMPFRNLQVISNQG